MPSPAWVGIGEPHTSRRAPEADAPIEVGHSNGRTIACAKPARGWSCNPTSLPGQEFTFLSPDSSTRCKLQAAERMTRQDRVQSLVPCICADQMASDCFKPPR
jgi:hypothetical protein